MFSGIKNIYNSFITPKTEDFYTKGWLTPEQFVEAGDQLTLTGWQWKKSPSKPSVDPPDPNKHFLIANAVSSLRIKHFLKSQGVDSKLDKDGFMVVSVDQKQEQQLNEEQIRNYTITITYDRKYHCPRMWIQGVSQSTSSPLTSEEIFEDIMSEYQNLTVTVENHSFLGYPQVTIHPCNHSTTLKAFIDKAQENGVQLKPLQALFVFLKFMQSVMPTVIYDATVDISLGD